MGPKVTQKGITLNPKGTTMDPMVASKEVPKIGWRRRHYAAGEIRANGCQNESTSGLIDFAMPLSEGGSFWDPFLDSLGITPRG